MKVKTPTDRSSSVGRFLVTVLVIVVILLVTLFFAVRTRGFQELIEARIETQLGIHVTAERMRIGWPYALVLEDVSTDDFSDGGINAGFAAQEIRLGPSLHARYRIFIRRGHLRLTATDTNGWEPTCFSRLGEWPYGELSDLTHMTAFANGHMDLEVSASRIEWVDGSGSITASAHGISYRVTPVRLPGRRMQYHALALDSMTRPGAERLSDVDREWLSSETIAYVELVDEQDKETVQP
ncbi:MAG: hypothetical protein HQ523_06150 [Lentisphaerae bacterium]|nr:hypothetical protein [Lentisphaerota bacterium]